MWKIKSHNKEVETKYLNDGKHRFLARVLSQRNLKLDNVDDFLKADYKNLSHPFELNDVEIGARIFLSHLEKRSRIAVIGDYDADGIISSTMLHQLCINFEAGILFI